MIFGVFFSKPCMKLSYLIFIMGFTFVACHSLKVDEVDTINLQFHQSENISPGQKVNFDIIVDKKEGKDLHSNMDSCRLQPDKYEPLYRKIRKKIYVIADSSQWENHIMIDSNLVYKGYPDIIRANLKWEGKIWDSPELLVDYKGRRHFNFNGKSGADGIDGVDGTDERDTTVTYRLAENGSSGGSGANGEDVSVYIDLVKYADSNMLSIKIKGESRKEKTLMMAQQSQIYISSDGGNGGNGGRGGNGGIDKKGRQLKGGDGGLGGNAGSGGTINIYITPKAEPYLNRFQFTSVAGIPGEGANSGYGTEYKDRSDQPLAFRIIGGIFGKGREGEDGTRGQISTDDGKVNVYVVDGF